MAQDSHRLVLTEKLITALNQGIRRQDAVGRKLIVAYISSALLAHSEKNKTPTSAAAAFAHDTLDLPEHSLPYLAGCVII